MNASVRPVGPTKVMGCPLNILYRIPPMPHDKINSMTPMVPLVIIFVKPPKATVGAKQVKKRNKTADMLFWLNPSVQSLL